MIPHLLEVVRALMVGAAVMAVLLARRVPSHRPVAVFIGAQTGIMLARWALLELYLRGAIAAAGGDVSAAIEPAPLHGRALVAGVAMNAGWLAWPAGLAAVSLWTFGRNRCRSSETLGNPAGMSNGAREYSEKYSALQVGLPGGFWLAAVAFIAITYPAGRPHYPALFAGAEVAAVVTGLGSAGSWAMRAWGREGLGIARGCVLFMVGCGAVSLAGPYVHGIFSTWWLANAVQLVMYSGLILVQGGALWVSRSR